MAPEGLRVRHSYVRKKGNRALDKKCAILAYLSCARAIPNSQHWKESFYFFSFLHIHGSGLHFAARKLFTYKLGSQRRCQTAAVTVAEGLLDRPGFVPVGALGGRPLAAVVQVCPSPTPLHTG